jgi:competence protein ComGC
MKGSIVKEMFEFIWKRKAFWMLPIILILLLLALLIVLSQGSAVAPFIYTLF